MTDRRHDTRFSAPLLAHIDVTVRPGHSVVLIDLGAGGAFVHSVRPLRPGGRVHVLLTSEARTIRIAAQVLRCAVVAIDACEGATYGGALQFDSRCELPWAHATQRG